MNRLLNSIYIADCSYRGNLFSSRGIRNSESSTVSTSANLRGQVQVVTLEYEA
jgi:hypothetical protein